MKFQWLSKLVIHEYDLSEVEEAIRTGKIPKDVDKTLPWCELVEPLHLRSVRLAEQHIAAGFVYNQASLPSAVRWWMAPSDPRINKAACWHDFLCPWGKEPPPSWMVHGVKVTLNSTEAANELYDGMRASGANVFDSATCSRMVKTFGPKF